MKQKMNFQNHDMILNNNAVVAKVPLTGSLKSSKKMGLYDLINNWIIRKQQRQYLLKLPNYLLDDIGLTRHDVLEESNKPFWQQGIF